MSGVAERTLSCVICGTAFVRTTRGPVLTCPDEECKYLNGRVTRMNANRKQRGLGRVCGRCGGDLEPQSRSHYCPEWCGGFRRTVRRRGGMPPAGAPESPGERPRRGRPVTRVMGMNIASLPEPHRSILRARFAGSGVPVSVEGVAGAMGLDAAAVVEMETEALEALGNAALGNSEKRWRYS